MTQKRIKIRIPIGITNIGPGIGVLGLALSIYNIVEFIETNSGTIEFEIKSLSKDIPTDVSNLLYRSANEIFKRSNYFSSGLKIICDQGIPVNKGLGSSGAAIIAGLQCAKILTDSDIDENYILENAYELDQEKFNCIPSYFGGLTISSLLDFTHVPIPVNNIDLKTVLIIPEFEYSKEYFHNLLPKEFSYNSIQNNIAKTAQFVTAICYNEPNLLTTSLKNEMLLSNSFKYFIPGLDDINLTCSINGGYGVSVCGQGPCLLVFSPKKNAEIIGKRIIKIFENFKISANYYLCDIDNNGTTVI
jgi:homoserine kinase